MITQCLGRLHRLLSFKEGGTIIFYVSLFALCGFLACFYTLYICALFFFFFLFLFLNKKKNICLHGNKIVNEG